MAWPFSRRTTYVASSPPSIKAADLNAMQDQIAVLSGLSIFFGTGEDGSAHLDGAATPAWTSRVGSVYTMTRDAFVTDLTMDAGTTLKTAGCRLYGTGTLTCPSTALIHNSGVDGAAGTTTGAAGGLGGSGLVLLGGGAGGLGNGHTSGFSSAGGDRTNSKGGAGGAGGPGDPGAASAGGTVTAPAAGVGGFGSLWNLLTGFVMGYNAGSPGVNTLTGGAGGGGGGSGDDGGGDGSNGGSGGGGGGIVLIFFKTVVLGGRIVANGGNGGVATIDAGAGYGGGGGGAGGGGVVILVYAEKTGSGTLEVTGGNGGAGQGISGAAGSDGSDGTVYEFALAA